MVSMNAGKVFGLPHKHTGKSQFNLFHVRVSIYSALCPTSVFDDDLSRFVNHPATDGRAVSAHVLERGVE